MVEDGSGGELAAVRSASVAELSWRDATGAVRVRGAVPLVGPDGPAIAFPYAAARTARSLGSADEVLLTLTDPHATGPAYRPLLLRCRPSLVEDREGDRFVAELLDQELRRYPPSRVYADSPLLRREHWWWLPRLILDLTVETTTPFPERATDADHLLVVDPDDGGDRRLAAAVARVGAGSGTPTVDVRSGTPGPGAAVLFGQQVSEDRERWGQWAWTGRWDGAALEVVDSPAEIGLPPVPGVVARWRRERDLERACRRGLGDGSGAGPG